MAHREKPANTWRALAVAMNRSEQACRKWMVHREYPDELPSRPPWTAEQVAAIRLWASKHLVAQERTEAKKAAAAAGKPETPAEALVDAMATADMETIRNHPQVRGLDADELSSFLSRVEKIKTERLKRDTLEGKYVLRDEVASDEARRVLAVKTGLMQLPRRVSADLAATDDPVVIETRLTNEIRRLLDEFANAVYG